MIYSRLLSNYLVMCVIIITKSHQIHGYIYSACMIERYNLHRNQSRFPYVVFSFRNIIHLLFNLFHFIRLIECNFFFSHWCFTICPYYFTVYKGFYLFWLCNHQIISSLYVMCVFIAKLIIYSCWIGGLVNQDEYGENWILICTLCSEL